jgi:hypothetical protein
MDRMKLARVTLALAALGLLAAPGPAAAQTDTSMYEVTITNLTSMQALSPPIIVTHPASVHAWQMGQTASEGVELVAEEGMNNKLAAEVSGVATDSAMGSGPLMPGKSVTLRVMAHSDDVLSSATMLVQTNDGFTGLDNAPLRDGSLETMAYDAGTEDNTEIAAHVPGPPFNGHNAGVATNPRGTIMMHPGITGRADVGTEFNWSGAVARYEIRSLGGVPGGMPRTGVGDLVPLAVALMAAAIFASGLGMRTATARARKR